MAYNNVKVKPRQTVAQSTSQTKELGIVSEVPMGDWNATTQYQKLNKVRYVSTGGSGVTLLAKKQNQGIEPFVAQGWQDVWMVENYDGGAVSPDGTYPALTAGNATNAQNDGNGENIVEQFSNINEKIPSSASAVNQLADKGFVNSSINAMAAFYITSNAQGDAFPTRTDLLNATTFYSGGQARVPTQNDYAIVLADESQPVGVDGKYPTTRYSYQGGTYPNGQWDFQYIVNNTSLTQAQVDAINSGITKELVAKIGQGAVTSVNGQTGEVILTADDINPFVICSTGSSAAAKVVTKEDFTLTVGARITVKFSFANTVNSPTLNVNNTGAIAIKADGDSVYVKWIAGSVMDFVYDGTNWVCTGGYQLQGKRVGTILELNNSTSPATLYGGSWTAITTGCYLKAITSGTPTYGEAGLPNIEGNFAVKKTSAATYVISTSPEGWSSGKTNGAFSRTVSGALSGQSSVTNNGTSYAADLITFDASNSNSIYGNSDTVTPLNRGAYMWYRTA